MTADQWRRVEELFERGLELDSSGRTALLALECSDDPAVARTLEAMWSNVDASPSFLDRPVAQLPDTEQVNRLVFERGHTVAERFTVLELLGAGGMGEVYRARDERLGRTVALKVLSARVASRPEFRLRLEREARAVSSLGHPRICALYDVGVDKDITYLVMELIAGEPLSARIARGPLPLPDVLSIGLQIAEALEAAHAAGIIHRDLKPANVMLTDSGVKLLDFGVAKRSVTRPDDLSSTMTAEGQIIGTVAYMSPEQADGKSVDARSDLFSLGTILYEMTTGEKPFKGDSSVSTLASILHKQPDPVRKLLPTSPAELDALIRRCLEKQPERRCETAAEVRERLVRIRERLLTTAARRRVAKASAVLATIAAGILLVVLTTSRRSTARQGSGTPVRLTAEAGSARYPSLSADGRLLAWASDRDGDFDIFLKRVGTDSEVRLTTTPYNETFSDFTPDGKYLVVQSDEPEAGLQVIPVAGGQRRILGKVGFRPRVSPDGSEVLYYTTGGYESNIMPGAGVWLIPVAGGSPRKLFTQLTAASLPIWFGDGYILFAGYDTVDDIMAGAWYLGRPDDSPPQKIDIRPGFRSLGEIRSWAWPLFSIGSTVYCRAQINDVSTITSLEIDVRKPAQVVKATRVFDSMGWLEDASATKAGQMAFAVTNVNHDLYRIRFDKRSGRSVEPPERLTAEPSEELQGTISSDGRILAFLSDRGGVRSVWTRDLVSKQDRRIGPTPANVMVPGEIAPDGRHVAFNDSDNTLSVAAVRGGPKITIGSGFSSIHWINPRLLATLRIGPRNDSFQEVRISYPEKQVVWEGPWMRYGAACFPAGRLNWCRFQSDEGTRVTARSLSGRSAPEYLIALMSNMSAFDFHADAEDVFYWHGREDGRDVVFGRHVNTGTGSPVGDAFIAHRFKAQPKVAQYGAHPDCMRNGSFILTMFESKSNIWFQELRP